MPLYLSEIATKETASILGVLCPFGIVSGVFTGQILQMEAILGAYSSYQFQKQRLYSARCLRTAPNTYNVLVLVTTLSSGTQSKEAICTYLGSLFAVFCQ